VFKVLKKSGLVLGLCLFAIWTQFAWIISFTSDSPAVIGLLIMAFLVTSGLLFCLLLHFLSRFVINQNESIPAWLMAMSRDLAGKLNMSEPKVHTLDSPGLNAFAIDNMTRHGHVFFHRQLLMSLTHDEVEAVLAHEMCHVDKGHAGALTFIQGVMSPVSLPIALFMSLLYSAVFGMAGLRINMVRINSFLSFVMFPLASLILLSANRFWEFEADACASNLVGKEQYLQVLRCLHGSFFQHPNLLTAFNGSDERGETVKKSQTAGLTHPSLAQRINALQEIGS
jgi:heat shock protein HtpX